MERFSLITLVCFFALAVNADCQSGGSSLGGIVYGPHGRALPNAPIQARNTATGAVVRAVSGASGRYTLASMPPGTYEIRINMPCCAFKPFVKDNVTVKNGESSQLDIRLEEGRSLNTYGDDPGTIGALMRNRSVIPRRPVPHSRDGKPDFSGVWLIGEDLYPEQPAALPWAISVQRERLENNLKDAPHTRCLPGAAGIPNIPTATTPFIVKFVHTSSLLVMLFEDVPGFRQIFLDGRQHPPDPDPTWLGHSVGKWEGDTLVIDTVGFNDRGWTGSFPRTEKMHTIERYRRPDFGHLEVQVTIDDPGVFVKPWNMNTKWDLAPQEELLEFICENNKAQNMVGK